MNLFDKLVDEALSNNPNLSNLRIVVEKELLHHDIFRILSQNDFLKNLTFIGGTCLRSCYGAVRLSEDLDFTGGVNFNKKSLSEMGEVLSNTIYQKYNLNVKVSEPKKDTTNVDTWKITVETRPESKNLPSQRINIDICSVNSYDKKPVLLINPYGVDMGTGGLIIQAQSREEIFTDKLLAFSLRPNRIKYRDLWDILWLYQQNIKPSLELIRTKLDDRNINHQYFINLFEERNNQLLNARITNEFNREMQRFLPQSEYQKILNQESLIQIIYNINIQYLKQMAAIF